MLMANVFSQFNKISSKVDDVFAVSTIAEEIVCAFI